MAKLKAIFYPRTEGDVVPYYDNAEDKLVATLAAKYGISPIKMGKVTTHNTDIVTMRNAAVAAQAAAQAANQAKDEEFAQAKFDMLDVLGDINRSSILDEADMEALGARVVHTPPDLNTVKPRITNVSILADRVVLDWIKGGMEAVIIYGSYNGTAWTEIGRDTRSPYDDTRPNQAAGIAEFRYYKMRYMKNDQPVGLESDVMKVVVDIA